MENSENKYDNEFVRKQLYEIHFKSKEFTYEECSEELNKMVKDFNEQDVKSDNFRKEYRLNHKFCPKCGAEGHSTTLMGYILDIDKKEEYKDLNKCECSTCGDKHTAHERVK